MAIDCTMLKLMFNLLDLYYVIVLVNGVM